MQKTNRKAALVGCSDPLSEGLRQDARRVAEALRAEGWQVAVSPLLFCGAASGKEKAEALNACFRDAETDYIFDVSGGDLANTVLPALDYDAIRGSRALFCGYSDLSVVLNAVCAKTGRPTVHYQVRNLVNEHAGRQLRYFRAAFSAGAAPPPPPLRFLRGNAMRGRIFGGNLRCFLKLAGTPYWPDLSGAILLLESYGGGAPQIVTALEQYRQLGVFDKIGGVILGTFTKMEAAAAVPSAERLALSLIPEPIPVAVSRQIGHGTDAAAIPLGLPLSFSAESPNAAGALVP